MDIAGLGMITPPYFKLPHIACGKTRMEGMRYSLINAHPRALKAFRPLGAVQRHRVGSVRHRFLRVVGEGHRGVADLVIGDDGKAER